MKAIRKAAVVHLEIQEALKACLHCALEPVSTDSGTGSARPH